MEFHISNFSQNWITIVGERSLLYIVVKVLQTTLKKHLGSRVLKNILRILENPYIQFYNSKNPLYELSIASY